MGLMVDGCARLKEVGVMTIFGEWYFIRVSDPSLEKITFRFVALTEPTIPALPLLCIRN